MWAPVLLILYVGFASAEYGWKAGSQYKYQIQSKTLTGLHQAADQYSGLLVKAQLTVQANTDSHLTLQVNHARYADVHRNLTHGLSTEITENELNFKELPLSNKAFQMYLKDGIVEKMVVEKNIPQWQLNFFKSIASQFQVDTQAKHLKKSKINLLPQEGNAFGTYKTMEDSINGIYETIYDVSPLPEYVIQSRPELAPVPHLKGNGQFIDIVKTRNFSNSEQHMVYRFGASGQEGWKAGSNLMGNFLSRSSISRVVLSGNLNRYTIQSSVTEEKVVVAPHLHNAQKGIVYGQMNVTLQGVSNSEESLQAINQPLSIKNLVYEYTEGNKGRHGGSSEEGASASNSDSSSSSSSSSDSNSSSSEENVNKSRQSGQKVSRASNEQNQRIKRSNSSKLDRNDNAQQSESRETSSSSSSSSSSDENSSSSSSSSSSESSSEEYLPEEPEMHQAPRIEFLPQYWGNYGSQQNDIVEKIKDAAQEVGKWIKSPGKIPAEQKLAHFSLLSQLVASASSQQLNQATEMLYYPESKAQQQESQLESQNYQAWLAFRDSIAQAGTGPALVVMREWINNGKVQGEEAAQLVAVLPNSARYPTTEYMNYFFEMMKSGEVQKQRFLNTSAIISFSELVRKSQVDQETSRNRYTIHLSGGKSQHHGREVRENYIPYFQSQLKKSLSQEDSIKIQVYIRAIGNTAHPQILTVFEPYLEGKQPVTAFQRLSMIAALDELTRVHPNLARSVLYRIYQNQGDLPEVRVAAVMQLMKTNPPAQMLQRMAEMTNSDNSKQVNAAVKSAIESAVSSDDYNESELSVNARTAVNMLTPDNYGAEYSRNFIRSYIVKEQEELHYKQQLSYIQGQDSIYPKAIMYDIFRTIGGYKREPYTASFMWSSADQLLNMLSNQFVSNPQKNKSQQQIQPEKNSYSYEKISNMLNMQPEQQEQLEGSTLFTLFGGKRFFSFDNHTIEQLPKIISEYHQKLQRGANMHFSKFYNQYSMEVGFPIATGFQFAYSLDVPTLVSFGGQLKGSLETEEQKRQEGLHAAANGKFQFTYSAQKKGQLGFVSQFNNQRYIAGADKNIFMHLPMQGKIEFNPQENTVQAEIQPLSQSNERQKLFQFSSAIYTTYQKTDLIKPYQKGENVQYVRAKPTKNFQKTIGLEESGYAVDVYVKSERNFVDMVSLLQKIQNYDLISYIVFHDMEETIGNSYLSISYNPQKSNPQPATFGLSYMNHDEHESSHKSSRITEKLKKLMANIRGKRRDDENPARPSSVEQRREELLRNVMAGMQESQGRVLDAFIRFGGEQGKNGYSLTVAHANSPVSDNSRLLVYARANPVKTSEKTKPFEAAFQLSIKEPRLPAINYEEALKSEPTTAVEGQLNLFEGTQSTGKLTIKGEMKRSEERREFLRKHSISTVCAKQMEENNYIQPACRNATVNAYYLDKYDFLVKYQDISAEIKEAVQALYGMARHSGFQHNEENTVQVRNPEGQLTVGVQFARNLKTLNVSIKAPKMSSNFENLRLHQVAIPLAVYNAKYNQLTLISQKLLHQQPIFTAVLDGNKVTTFNNKTYPVELGNSYHVFSMYVPQSGNENEQKKNKNNEKYFAILVKERDNQQKDVQVILGNDNISLESGSGKPSLKVNGQEIQVNGNKMGRWSNSQNYLEAHSHPDNTVVIKFPRTGIKLVYDTKRIQLTLNNGYRNNVRGLAGSFDGEQVEDFTLPNNQIQKNPREFAAMYALMDSTSESQSKERQEQAKNSKSYEKRIIYGNVISDREAGRSEKAQSSNKNHLSSQSQKEQRRQNSCSVYGLKVVEDKGRTCFSSRPHVTCSPECRPTKNIQKTIDFHCIEHSTDSRRWVEMIKKGATPDFSQKASNLKIAVNLPESCTQN